MKKITKIIALILSLSMSLSFALATNAAEIEHSGGSGSTPVSLSTTTDGSIGGNPSATAMRVTVPTALPMALSQDGVVTTADNCYITNHSYGAVRVSSVSITAAGTWHLTSFGDKTTLASKKVDSNYIGFSISVGGGEVQRTDTSSEKSQMLIDRPISGCYMSGVGDPSANSVKVSYDAIVTPLSTAVTDATVATVVFIVEWDTAA